MKKKFSTLTAVAFVVAMTFAFTGCGTKDTAPAETPSTTEETVIETEDSIVETTSEAAAEETAEAVPTETETAAEETTEEAAKDINTEAATETATAEEEVTTETTAAENAEAAGGVSTLEEFVNDSEVQTAMQAMAGSQDEMSIRLYAADDKTVVFDFTFAEQLPLTSEEDKQSVAKLFEEAMALQKEVFVQMRDELATETGINDVVVRIEYINADGTILYAIDYTK